MREGRQKVFTTRMFEPDFARLSRCCVVGWVSRLSPGLSLSQPVPPSMDHTTCWELRRSSSATLARTNHGEASGLTCVYTVCMLHAKHWCSYLWIRRALTSTAMDIRKIKADWSWQPGCMAPGCHCFWACLVLFCLRCPSPPQLLILQLDLLLLQRIVCS